MSLRLTSKDLLGNLLAANAFTRKITVSRSQLKEFENALDGLIPGYIYFETGESDFQQAIQELSGFCGMDCDGHVYLKHDGCRPDRKEINYPFPLWVSQIIGQYTDYFVEVILNENPCRDSLEWYINRQSS